MKCSNCGREVTSEMIFCPECGTHLEHKKVCYYCGSPLLEEDQVCPICGLSQVVETKQEEVVEVAEDPYKGYWKKPIIWIISAICIFASMALMNYMVSHPLYRAQTNDHASQDIKISGDISEGAYFANIQAEGQVVKGDYLYIANADNLYQVSLDLKEKKKIASHCEGYLSLVDNKLYYCGDNYDYYCYDIDQGESEKILRNIYYPSVVDQKIYYQDDSDHESIHIYDLTTNEDTKINDEASYGLTVDQENQKIYYFNKNKEFCAIGFDGNHAETIYDEDSCYAFVGDKDYLYVACKNNILKIDKKTYQSDVIIDGEYRYINIVQDQLVYQDNKGLYLASLNGKNEKVLYDRYFDSFSVIGDCIILNCYDQQYNDNKMIIDLEGNNQYIFAESEDDEQDQQYDFDDDSQDEQDIDGARDF